MAISRLTLFGEQVTPNLHQLAREYTLYDNFYENADVSADGHNWAAAAIAPDYTMKLWPSEYGHRSKVYDFEGGEPANSPPAGYLWDNALQAGCQRPRLRRVGHEYSAQASHWSTADQACKRSGPGEIYRHEFPQLRSRLSGCGPRQGVHPRVERRSTNATKLRS